MIYNVYAIKDDASSFLAPTIETTDAVAIRSFKIGINDARNQIMYFNKSDFNLYRIGNYDVETGQITPFNTPILVFRGSDVERMSEDV